MHEVVSESVRGLLAAYRARRLSPVEVVRAYLERIEALNPVINAYVVVTAERALDEARAAESQILRDVRRPLLGVPIAVKDLVDASDVPTTAGSKILAGRVPRKDATVVARLRAAGAILLGKTNTHEFGIGGTTQNPHYGGTRNPWDLTRDPGGSSGGSAAATAARLCLAAIGTDSGGSIRLPAAACGIVGFKPTRGRIPLTGVFPLAWTLDHVGPMTRTVDDAALLLGSMAGYDPEDASAIDATVPSYTRELENGVRGLRVGVIDARRDGLDQPAVVTSFDGALAVLEKLGALLRPIEASSLARTQTTLNVIAGAESAEIHRRWLLERPADYGSDVRARLEGGLAVDAATLAHAYVHRRELILEYRRLLRDVDVIVAPTTPGTAQPVGSDEWVEVDGEHVPRRYLICRYLWVFNLTGLPAIAVPNGFDSAGLPTSMQFAGRPWDEPTVLRAARAFELASGIVARSPSLA